MSSAQGPVAFAESRAGPARDSVTRIVSGAAIFEGCRPGDVIAAMQLFHPPVVLRRRDIVFTEGDPGDAIYLVVAGRIRLSRRTAGGRDCLTAVLGPSDVFGELAVFDPSPRTVTATATSNTILLAMDRVAMHTWMRERSELAELLLTALARRLQRTEENVAYLCSASIAVRLAVQLLTLADRFGAPKGRTIHVGHGLTQDDIGQLVGSSRETVGKILTDFRRRGWITVTGKHITITNAEDLGRMAGSPPWPPAARTVTV
ncbi:cAMP receptor protein [Mycolicibacterium chubuense]|uniref:cAMP receptor protein n=1 Tax=Mycolicibacterium chubuense TaxID=1800 RepID=A0A0J6WB25_MYCCU|nr:cAMP receptor protein [Mycolicibacterium chubuense]SPX96219.1 Crp/Fnr familytranscriptional regulator [Mycolicibacterium chubuense]